MVLLRVEELELEGDLVVLVVVLGVGFSSSEEEESDEDEEESDGGRGVLAARACSLGILDFFAGFFAELSELESEMDS